MINRLITEHGISKQDILGVFYSSSSHAQEGIGMELERIPIDNNQNTAVYSNGENGVKEILEEISQELYWQKIYDDNVLIGLKQSNATITLEPGCQVEISVDPQNNITDLKYEIEKIDKEIKPIFNKYGIKLLEYGISPKSTVKDIKIFPKKRYKYMANYLSGILAPSMMKETAGIQVSVDYKNEEDAIKKLRIFTKISPVMTAIFANSPCRNGKFTGYKSTRALAWLNTDNNRCGLISEKLFDKNYNFTLKDFLNSLIPDKLIDALLDKYNKLSDEDLINTIKNLTVLISEVGDFDKAQCGSGGVSFELCDNDLMVKSHNGLYLCGELLDIDGICGGYNLSLAFATGAIAGRSAAK